MELFGWSLPPGCTGTPFDDAGAIEVKAEGLSPDITVFWVEDGTVMAIYRAGADDEKEVDRFNLEWNDDLNDEGNMAAAASAVRSRPTLATFFK